MPPAIPPVSPSVLPDAQPSTPAAFREVELKLHAASADLARVASLPGLLALADGPATTQRLRTAYFDTPDLKLAANGVALRVRQEGDRFIQTLKTVNSASPGDSAAVAVRREWEWVVAGEAVDIGVLSDPGVAGLVPAAALDALDCLFITDFRRTTLLLRPDTLTAVELAVDDGAIYAGGNSLPVGEVELELKAGKVASLFDLALTLQAAIPMRIGTESKAEAGLRLVTGKAPGPVEAEPLGLSPLTTVAEAYRHILRQALRQFLANESCALAGGDVEGLHRMRVALRRLRIAHRFFAPLVASPEADRLVEESRALAKRLGPARGWDVLMSGVIDPLLANPKAAPGIDRTALERLASLARTAGAGPAREAMAAILAPGCTTMVLALAAWLEHGRWMSEADGDRRAALSAPVTTVAGGWLSARMAKLGKTAKPPEDAKARDKLRRRLRTLRYTADFFRGLYPEAATLPFFAALEPLQAALDAEQDAITGARMLGSLKGGEQKTAAAVAAWIDRQSDKRRKALPDLWKRFRAVPPFWS
ncbi:CHAD domain-containing protein [Azospirillum sp. CT11-132]|uniref:CYTH and CHAD domain-containing protein n=1 Tax=unclassified Azospirillum TaxID=2630922 RepID=UPI000D61F87A|nr:MULTISPECIES: CYTH and CHAD domain-containing protein [unclassified Azospirillum]PWC62399.1 metal-chelation protein CHAD [Azospirillum sp. TSH7]PWC65889.1 metal-chelation protein CHAD [Azospirillum sp. TSH20]